MTAAMHGRTDGVYCYGPPSSSDPGIGHCFQPQHPVARAGDPADLRMQTTTSNVPVREEVRFAEELCKNIKVVDNEPVIEDILREINRSCWTIGYTGCSRSG